MVAIVDPLLSEQLGLDPARQRDLDEEFLEQEIREHALLKRELTPVGAQRAHLLA
jgi:hypothetical protein